MSRFEAITRELGKHGLWCFPVLQKIPLVESWVAYRDHAPSPGEIAAWVRRWPNADAGVPTGPKAVVIDADSLDAIERLHRRGMPRTWQSATRRGMHYWFQSPSDLKVRNSAGLLGEHIDVRGWGGYVVWYPWAAQYSPTTAPLAELPAWVLNHLRWKETRKVSLAPDVQPPINPSEALGRQIARLKAARVGTRNATLASVAWILGARCGRGELKEQDCLSAMLDAASDWEGEPVEKSRKTIERQFTEGQAHRK